MVNVVVSRKRNVKVSTNATAGVIDTSIPVTLKNTPIIPNVPPIGSSGKVLSGIRPGKIVGPGKV